MVPQLRIARPVSDVPRSAQTYCLGPGLSVVGSFENHDGFDGVMLGAAGADYHFEFTYCRAHPVLPAPTAEDLVVFHVPDAAEWQRRCAGMAAAGFIPLASFNPYRAVQGCTFEDHDGHRAVLQQEKWRNVVAP